ncbi:MAG: hypothetical protein LBU53_12365 [Zoogloeaceae bacterium]|jgi:uncharacterized protein YpmS|nr:hypothetical protein [Zoogloeaceae bacterium]
MASADETPPDTRYWHIRLHKRNALLGLLALGVLLLFTFVAKMGLLHEELFKHRSQAVVVMVAAREARQAINQQLKNDPHASIAASTVDSISTEMTYKTVAHDGVIVVFSQQTGTLIVYRPQVDADGEVNWTCWGASAYGNEILPTECRIPQP